MTYNQYAAMRAQTQIPTVHAATTRVVVYTHMLGFARSTVLAAWTAHVFEKRPSMHAVP